MSSLELMKSEEEMEMQPLPEEVTMMASDRADDSEEESTEMLSLQKLFSTTFKSNEVFTVTEPTPKNRRKVSTSYVLNYRPPPQPLPNQVEETTPPDAAAVTTVVAPLSTNDAEKTPEDDLKSQTMMIDGDQERRIVANIERVLAIKIPENSQLRKENSKSRIAQQNPTMKKVQCNTIFTRSQDTKIATVIGQEMGR